ncbi:MAG: penicillin-insensitive murein endopeptidase [Pseudomonadota bacterium]
MKRLLKSAAALAALLSAVFYANAAFSGRVACGSGFAPTKAMPIAGPNFRPYCWPCVAALRTFGRVPAINSVVTAFEVMAEKHPNTVLVYGEIGFPNGGIFRPHRTHRQGLDVDIMVPLKDGRTLTTSVTNRFGYDVEFDANGDGDDGEIDFAALGDLILEMQREARQRGGDVARVILAPDLQPELRAANPAVFNSVKFNTRQAWVRHDDHIHVDFVFRCDE